VEIFYAFSTGLFLLRRPIRPFSFSAFLFFRYLSTPRYPLSPTSSLSFLLCFTRRTPWLFLFQGFSFPPLRTLPPFLGTRRIPPGSPSDRPTLFFQNPSLVLPSLFLRPEHGIFSIYRAVPSGAPLRFQHKSIIFSPPQPLVPRELLSFPEIFSVSSR